MGEVLELALIAFILVVFGIPVVAILTEHQRKMAQLRLESPRELKGRASGEIAELRQQVTDLRDLTTKYDLSFDQALQRIESRVAHIEGRLQALEQERAQIGSQQR